MWPRSRNKTPKQFLKLFNNRTLTQITVERFSKILPWERIFCITVSQEYKKEILKEVPEFLVKNIIVEPARRETGPAHGVGAAFIHKKDSDAVIITESADRLVEPVSKYLSTLKIAAETAYKENVLITVGVKPRYPHVGLGHIKKGARYKEVRGITFYKLDKFVEKPPLALAKRYTASGNYYWNAGQFVWRADSILQAIEKYAPDIYSRLQKISKALTTANEKRVFLNQYKSMPKISIDYAVAEKADNFLTVEAKFFWTDIGDWKEVWNNLGKDEAGNVIIDGDEPGGEVINLETSDTLIHKNGRLIAIIDVDNIIVVDTKDVLLICSKSKAQNVKKVVQYLEEKGKEKYL